MAGLLCVSCAGAEHRADQEAYSLIRPSGGDGAGAWAIIDREGDPTEIVPEEGIAYEVELGLTRDEALRRASQGMPASELSIRSIPAPIEAAEVGIEVLPGVEQMKAPPNIVRIEYRVDEAGRLRFNVRLLPLYSPARPGIR